MSGRINLWHKENMVRTCLFNNESHRLNLIEGWKKLYGKGFDKTRVETITKKLKKELPVVKLAVSNFKKGSLPKIYKLRRCHIKPFKLK